MFVLRNDSNIARCRLRYIKGGGGGLLFGDFTVFARLGTCVLALLGL